MTWQLTNWRIERYIGCLPWQVTVPTVWTPEDMLRAMDMVMWRFLPYTPEGRYVAAEFAAGLDEEG